MRALLVPVDGDMSVVEVSGYPDSRRLVGGYLEAIGGEGWTAYLNEEGDRLCLPVNLRADALARALGWQSLPGNVLVGPVYFCGPPDANSDDTDVHPAIIRAVGLQGD